MESRCRVRTALSKPTQIISISTTTWTRILICTHQLAGTWATSSPNLKLVPRKIRIIYPWTSIRRALIQLTRITLGCFPLLSQITISITTERAPSSLSAHTQDLFRLQITTRSRRTITSNSLLPSQKSIYLICKEKVTTIWRSSRSITRRRRDPSILSREGRVHLRDMALCPSRDSLQRPLPKQNRSNPTRALAAKRDRCKRGVKWSSIALQKAITLSARECSISVKIILKRA